MYGQPAAELRGHPARWWHKEGDRVVCDLCPRYCKIPEGQHGFCYIRQNRGGELVTIGYGHPTGFAVDPIEKKPLNHFFPGTEALSFGTAGCNLGCKFCQNWSISKAKLTREGSLEVSPEEVVALAERYRCASIAYTYNDPVIFAEYMDDIARIARGRGIHNVAVTAGYVTPEARAEVFAHVDAANVDLKAFHEAFYRKVCGGVHLEPVKETLCWLVHETRIWVEITTLLIPGHNDSPDEIRKEVRWIRDELGVHVPLHFTAFHPDYRMLDIPPTPATTLRRAREIALEEGLWFVYTGNVRDPEGQTTYCPHCRRPVIVRDGYTIVRYELDGNLCRHCGEPIPGQFAKEGPGRNLPVPIPVWRPGEPHPRQL